MSDKRLRLGVAILATVVVGGLGATAANASTWSGASGGLWSNPANWDALPTPGDPVIFPNLSDRSVDVEGGVDLTGSAMSVNKNDYTFGSSPNQLAQMKV